MLLRQLFGLTPLLSLLTGCRADGNPKFVRTSLHITSELGAPNGQDRWLLKVNGTLPGPQLVFEEGDDVEITVYNDTPEMNVTVHWHGIEMAETPWSDGVPGLSQIPITPGKSFIHRFKAYPAGQYWYHSHARATLMDGLYGSLFVRRKQGSPEPWNLISDNSEDIEAMRKAARDPKPVLISDWSHLTSNQYLQVTVDTNVGHFCSDSILINGKGSVYCPGQEWMTAHQTFFMSKAWQPPATVSDKGCFPYVPKTVGDDWMSSMNLFAIPPGMISGCVPSAGSIEIIEVDPKDKWVSLNFISAATLKFPEVGIDNHTMWIYEVDGQLIEPKRADTFAPFAGERYSVMVKLDQKHQDYPIRIPDSSITQIIAGYALMRYKSRHKPAQVQIEDWYKLTYRGEPTTAKLAYNGVLQDGFDMFDDSHIHPFPSWDPSLKPARKSDQHFILDMSRVGASWRTAMNWPYQFPTDYNSTMPLIYHPNDESAHDERYIIRTRNGTWVDIVLQLAGHDFWPTDGGHATHKHGNKFWMIAIGDGVWNYTTVDEAMEANPHAFNLDNPPLRDTFRNGFVGAQWMVLRYQVVNPGPWLLHCHVETHVAMGMAVAIMDGVDVWPEIPEEYAMGQNGHRLGEEPTASEPTGQSQSSSLLKMIGGWEKVYLALLILLGVLGFTAVVVYSYRLWGQVVRTRFQGYQHVEDLDSGAIGGWKKDFAMAS